MFYLISIEKYDYILSIKIVTVIAVFIYAYIIISVLKLYGHMNFLAIFIIISFFFFFGQHVLVLFNNSELYNRFYSILDGRISSSSHIFSSYFILISIISLYTGSILNYSKRTMTNNQIKSKISESQMAQIGKNTLFITGLIIVFVTIIPAFYNLYRLIQLTQLYGYAERVIIRETYGTTGLEFVFSYLSAWFVPGISMIMVSTHNKRKSIRIWLFLLTVYSILYLLSGGRYEIIQIIFIVYCIQFYLRKKIRIRMMLVYSLGLILLLFVFRFVTEYRVDISNGLNWIDIVSNVFKSGIVYETLSGTGASFLAVSNVIDKAGSIVSFAYGKSYLYSVFIILPKPLRFGLDYSNYITEIAFSHLYLVHELVGNMGHGSSFIAEGYYNFGILSLLLFMIIGYSISSLSINMYYYSFKHDLAKFWFVLFVSSLLVLKSRSDLFDITRDILYYGVLPLGMYKLLLDIQKKRIGESRGQA